MLSFIVSVMPPMNDKRYQFEIFSIENDGYNVTKINRSV